MKAHGHLERCEEHICFYADELSARVRGGSVNFSAAERLVRTYLLEPAFASRADAL